MFHKNSIKIIRASVFGMNKDGKVGDRFHFENNLVITNIDVQCRAVDDETRNSLQKSVQMAIQITTDSQEAAAKHNVTRRGASQRRFAATAIEKEALQKTRNESYLNYKRKCCCSNFWTGSG